MNVRRRAMTAAMALIASQRRFQSKEEGTVTAAAALSGAATGEGWVAMDGWGLV
jgi:hypothetical protein